MHLKDISNNEVANSLYESYLSKAILESSDLYKEIFIKIASLIKDVIELNSHHELFNRKLFSAFSALNSEFPGYDGISKLLDTNFSIFAAAAFHKLFFEFVIEDLKIHYPSTTNTSSLSAIIKSKINNNEALLNNLRQSLHPDFFFADERSGRKNKKATIYQFTTKLGVTSEENATEDLKNFFGLKFVPGQNKYFPDEKSSAFKWLKSNNLPFASGISGTVGACYCGLVELNQLTVKELRTYLMVLSATLVARGHHSFAETHPVISKIGFPVEIKPERKSYYEQFLTAEFIESEGYKEFLEIIRDVLSEEKRTLAH